MMNRWVALAFGGSMGVIMLFAAGSLKLGDMGMKEHMGWPPPVASARALSDDGAETVPGRALHSVDAPSLRLVDADSCCYLTAAAAPDGRAVFVDGPPNAMVFFDSANDNFETIDISEIGTTANDEFYASVTLPDSKIVLVPAYGDGVGIIDAANQNIELVDVGTWPETCWGSKFNGGALAPNGKVIFGPAGCRAVGIFDPVSKELELSLSMTLVQTLNGVSSYYGCYAHYYTFSDTVATTDSKVVFVPFHLHAVGIFDSADQSLELVEIDDQIADFDWKGNMFGEGALAPNGKLIFAPYYAPALGIFDPSTKIFQLVDVPDLDYPRFWGAVFAPASGKVVFAPGDITSVGVFDPATSAFEAIYFQQLEGIGDELSRDAVALPNGEIIFPPYESDKVMILSLPTTTTTSMLKIKLKLKVKGQTKAWLKVKVANGHVNATAKVSSRRRRG